MSAILSRHSERARMRALLMTTSAVVLLSAPAFSQSTNSTTQLPPIQVQQVAPKPAQKKVTAKKAPTPAQDQVAPQETAIGTTQETSASATALGTYNPALDLDGMDLPPGTTITTAGPVQGYRALSAMSSTKTATPVEKIPQSIGIVPRSVIDDQKNITVGESLRNVSGVVINSSVSTPAFDSTIVRGFAVDQMVDGLTTYYSPGDRESSINVERIEVLKGPSGLLYGGGPGTPVGGAVNIVSKLPHDVASGKVGITYGSHEHVQPFFDINQPVSPNVLFRITGEYTSAESFIDVIETERYNINPTVTFTDKSTTTLTIQGRLADWKQPEYQGLPATGTVAGSFRLPRETFLGPSDIEDSHSRYEGVTATLDHKLNSIWSINVKGRLSQSSFEENVQTIVGSDSFAGDAPFIPPSTWARANAELFQEQEEGTITGYALAKFELGGAENKLLFGGDYSRVKDQGFINFAFLPFFGLIDLASNPSFTAAYTDPGPRLKDQISIDTTKGVFAELQTSLWDRVHLVAGIRGANVTIDYQNTTAGTRSVTDTYDVLPRFGAVVDVVDGFSLFAGYSEGMRGQPFLNFLGSPEPERSDQIEGGVKFNILNQFSGTLALFEVNRDNVATTDPATFLSLTNGVQRARGFEADVVWQPLPGLQFLASYAYTDAEYVKEVPATAFSAGIPAGNVLASVPEHSGRIWANYAFQSPMLVGLSVGAGIYMSSEKYTNAWNTFSSDSFFTVDAKVAYEAKHYEVALALKNLTDERYFDSYNYFDARVAPSDGFTAFGTIALKY